MRLIVIALLLALAISTAQAVPLQGSDGTAIITLFGAIRAPLNDTSEILKVDIGLMGTENATYKLVDAEDTVYEAGLYKTLSSGRQLVYFIIPKDDLFKLFVALPSGGKAININWWATPKKSNENLVIRYYGITDWLINPDEQGIVVQVRAQNNGTQDLLVSPEDFTLLDQWGWPYSPTAGFDAEIIGPQNASSTRVLLGFTGIPLLSKPAYLAYNYDSANKIVIDFDKDYVPLSDATVYGANASSTATAQPAPISTAVTPPVLATPAPAANQTNQTAAAPANNTSIKLSSLKEKIAASKLRLGAVGGSNASGQKSAVGQSITSSLNATRERLAATRANLDKKTQNNTSNNTSTSNVPLNSTLNSTLNNTLNNTRNDTLNKTANVTPNGMLKSISSTSA